MSDLPTCLAAPDLVSVRRFVVWSYGNDWDGWHLRYQTDDRAEAEEYVGVLVGERERGEFRGHGYDRPAFSGVMLAETLVQAIRPTFLPPWARLEP